MGNKIYTEPKNAESIIANEKAIPRHFSAKVEVVNTGGSITII